MSNLRLFNVFGGGLDENDTTVWLLILEEIRFDYGTDSELTVLPLVLGLLRL